MPNFINDIGYEDGSKLYAQAGGGAHGKMLISDAVGGVSSRYSNIEDVSGRLTVREHSQSSYYGLGAEILTDPQLEGTYSTGRNAILNSIGGAVCTQESDARSGAKAQGVKWSSNLAGTKSLHITQSTRTPGEWVAINIWAKRVSGAHNDLCAYFYAPAGSAGGITSKYSDVISTNYELHRFVFRAPDNDLEFGITTTSAYQSIGVGIESDKIIIDDISCRIVPFTSLISISDSGKYTGKWFASVDLVNNAMGGIVFHADTATPSNFLILYHDGSGIKFKKIISGVWANAYASENATRYNKTYIDSARLSVIREPDTNNYAIYYNGLWVSTETISDTEIITNTFHGSFSTHDGNHIVFTYSPAEIILDVVFFGGSITNGSGATDQWFSWRWKLMGFMDINCPSVSFRYHNSSAGGTDSFYALTRLNRDVLAYTPSIVFIDQVVNDTQLLSNIDGYPYVGEAIVRKIRSTYPLSKIVVCDFTKPFGSDQTPTTRPVTDAWEAIATHYNCHKYNFGLAVVDELGEATAAEIASAYFADAVHPNNAGHALAMAGLAEISYLSPDSFTNIDDYGWVNTSASKYYSPAKIIPGVALINTPDASGSWTTSDDSILSSTAGVVCSYSGIMSGFGLNVTLQTGAWPSGLEYSVDGGVYQSVSASNGNVENSEIAWFSGAPIERTIRIKLASGSVQINSFLVV